MPKIWITSFLNSGVSEGELSVGAFSHEISTRSQWPLRSGVVV